MDHRARNRLASCTMSNRKTTIHARNLNFYEKSHSTTTPAAEEPEGKNDEEEDCDDFKIRRRNPVKLTSSIPPVVSTVVVAAPFTPPIITDEIREQLGLAKPITTIEYDRLVLSLLSPLPNEQDMAISVCTLLSNDTRHALKFEKCPAVMEVLLAHAGIFNHCNTRILMEETYEKARGFNFQNFWRNAISNSDVRELFCECSLERYQNGAGIFPVGRDDVSYADDSADTEKLDDDEDTKSELVQSDSLLDQSVVSNQPSYTSAAEDDSGESKSEPVPLDVVDGLNLAESTRDSLGKLTSGEGECQSVVENIAKRTADDDEPLQQDQDSGQSEPLRVRTSSCALNVDADIEFDDEFIDEIKPPGAEKEVLWDLLDTDVTASNVDCEACCPRCPCLRQPGIFETPAIEDDPEVLAAEESSALERIGQRIHQVASIIRNLSFDKENAEIMGQHSGILRFILVTANCSYGTLNQLSFDTLGNIATFMNLEDPLENPYFGMVLSLVIDGVFSFDRFRVLRSLETIREWCRLESNETTLAPVMDAKFFSRLCEFLSLCDIMMLVYTLECILSITSMGLEDLCNELVRVNGSVDTLVSLVTVEAQSYGPKGCIQMRVVETLVGQSAFLHLLRNKANSAAMAGTDPQSVPPVSNPQSMTPVVAPPHDLQQTNAIEAQNKPISLPPALVATVSPQIVNMTVERQTQSPTPTQNVQLPMSPAISPTAIYIKPAISQPVQMSPVTSMVDSPRPLLPAQSSANVTVPVPAPALPTPRLTFTSVPITTSLTTTLQNGVYSVKSEKLTQEVAVVKKVASIYPILDVDKNVYSFNPEVNVASPPGAVGEDVWALMWIKAAFEQVSGCSIEQGKMYRMYCTARKDPNEVLPMEDFIKCAREAYGAGIGPVIKNFGGNPLSFLEGLRPTMTLTSVGNGISGQANVVKHSNSDSTTNNLSQVSNEQSPQPNAIEQYIPPKETNKTTSPILKATLSRPPKTPKTSPVTQRQQKKQQVSESKHKSPGNSCEKKKKVSKLKKINGVELIFKAEPDVSSASSSIQSTSSVDSVKANPPLSFQGILRNGLSMESGTKAIDENGKEDSDEPGKCKGMLVDLLERKVVPRENTNGLLGSREIRISDRGLELVDQDGLAWKSLSGTSNYIQSTVATTISNSAPTVSKPNPISSNINPKCQEMTFYAVPDIQVPGDSLTPNCKSEDQTDDSCFGANGKGVVLMSGGGRSGDGGSEKDEEHKETVDINMDDADLLEKFNEISDLIVVPPEQFGLKRPRTTEEKAPPEEPPPKKKVVEPTTQYAFARPLVFSAGQQILLQTSNNSGSLHGAKVIISRPTNSTGDQRQAYFILQPQQTSPGSGSAPTNPTPTAIKLSPLTGIPRIPIPSTSLPVQNTSSSNVISNDSSSKNPPLQGPLARVEMPGLSSVPIPIVTNPISGAVPATNCLQPQATRKTSEQLDLEVPHLCEWLGCGQRFLKHEQILMHALQTHAPPSLTEAIRCDWHTSGCDGLYRKRFSLMTHLQDRHCSKSALDASLYRRKNKIEPPPPPQTPMNHLGYAPNAAFHAIRRHALQFSSPPKELLDDIEGPVTKSIRLTSALILKNLCNYSLIGRRAIKRHESHLASVAMSNVESARTISQLLFDLNELGS